MADLRAEEQGETGVNLAAGSLKRRVEQSV
jgi:hypothetical protein